MSILVTGANGYIGSSFLSYMSHKYTNLKFIGIDRMSNTNHQHILNHCVPLDQEERNVILIKVDLSIKEDIIKIFSENQIDVVLHFMSASRINDKQKDIFIQSNVIVTNNLLEISSQNHVKRFIFISSDEVFGNSVEDVSEDSSLNPVNFYGLSKVFGELLMKYYFETSKLEYVIARLTNVYGPGQYPDRLISRFCCRLLKGQKCQINGSGSQKRSLIYIDDCLLALELLLFTDKVNTIYNINSNQRFNIKSIAENLVSLIFPSDVLSESKIEYNNQEDTNNKDFTVTCNKIYEIGWKQSIDLMTGLQLVIDWYKENNTLWPDDQMKKALGL